MKALILPDRIAKVVRKYHATTGRFQWFVTAKYSGEIAVSDDLAVALGWILGY